MQAGDADLVALARHRSARHRRLEPHPVLRMEVVAPGRRRGEVDAGARRLGLGLGADAADQQAGGAAGVGQDLAQLRVVGRALGRRLQRLDGLCRPVQHVQCVGHQQQGGDLVGAGLDRAEVAPGGLQGAVGLGRGAVHLRLGEGDPELRAGLAPRVTQSDAGFQRGRGGGPVVSADRHVGLRLGLAAGLRRAAGGETLGQQGGVGVGIGGQAGQGEVVRPGGPAGQGQQRDDHQR
jgi:hypothetical protein